MKSSTFQRRISRRPAKSEHCLQRAVVRWCDGLGSSLVRGRFFAVPNGGARDIITGAKLKAEGVRPGSPDLVFFASPGRVLWIEMKNGTSGKISEKQKILHQLMRDNAHDVVVCRDLIETITVISNFYQQPNNNTQTT